jgi:hypothetical protein
LIAHLSRNAFDLGAVTVAMPITGNFSSLPNATYLCDQTAARISRPSFSVKLEKRKNPPHPDEGIASAVKRKLISNFFAG